MKNTELYTEVNKLFGDELPFFNHGYYPFMIEDDGTFCATSKNLYHYVLQSSRIGLNTALDVGCGRGKGVDYMQELNPTGTFHGLDSNADNIDYCKKNSRGEFTLGDASTELPYDDESFALVTNIESSHDYGNRKKFFDEVNRVLKWSGCFAYVDNFNEKQFEQMKKEVEDTDLSLIRKEDITENVLSSLVVYLKRVIESNLTNEQKNFLIDALEPYISTYAKGEVKYFAIFFEKG